MMMLPCVCVCFSLSRAIQLTTITAKSPDYQGQKSRQGREGAIREDGREDAQEACRETQEEGEAKQAHQLMSLIAHAQTCCWNGHCDRISAPTKVRSSSGSPVTNSETDFGGGGKESGLTRPYFAQLSRKTTRHTRGSCEAEHYIVERSPAEISRLRRGANPQSGQQATGRRTRSRRDGTEEGWNC